MADNNKDDLTRIEDLGEFHHEEDEDLSFDDFTIPHEDQEKTTIGELPDFETPEDSLLSEDITKTSFDFNQPESLDFNDLPEDEQNLEPSHENNFDSPQEDETSSFANPDFNDEDNLTHEAEEIVNLNETDEDLDFALEESQSSLEDNSTLELPSSELPPLDSDSNQDNEISPTQLSSVESEENGQQDSVNQEFNEFAQNDLRDIKKFANQVIASEEGMEAYPAYSVVIEEVKYIEEVDSIIELIKETKLYQEDDERLRLSLERGKLLIPRISEFAAIYLANKLRQFNLKFKVGLSDTLYAKASKDDAPTIMISKKSIGLNRSHHFVLDQSLRLENIILSTTSQVEGFEVSEYISIVTEHIFLSPEKIEDEKFDQELSFIYEDLAKKLKPHALKNKANGIIGVNYQLTPILRDEKTSQYKLTCTGNLVWLKKS